MTESDNVEQRPSDKAITTNSSDEESGDEYFSDSEEEDQPSKLVLLMERFAVFGDSPLALLGAFAMLLLAVGTALWINQDGALDKRQRYPSLGPVPRIDPPRIFEVVVEPNSETTTSNLVTDEMRAAYQKDGVVAVRGLLSRDLLTRLDGASGQLVQEQYVKDKQRRQKRSGTQFHMVRMGAVFLDPPNLQDDSHDNDTEPTLEEQGDVSAFRDVALLSAVPQVAADLMALSAEKNETLRILRDIFLTKDDEEYVCGWHVDDLGFWPATASSPGVNAWIALDDMPTMGGGGFALAVGSHSAPWRHDAHRAIGSTLTFPPEGFQSAADMFENRTGAGTCNLESEAPHIHKRMEETRRVYDVKRGDVLFHERWLFHRTVPFDRSVVKQNSENEEQALIYRRYSVRYGPGSSEIPRGFGTELSVLWDADNGGRTADEVARVDGPWYPKCWPNVSEEEIRQLRNLVETKVPKAEERRDEVQKEMQPFLKKMGKIHQSKREKNTDGSRQ